VATGTDARPGDRGAAVHEYGGILLLVGSLVVALVAAGLPATAAGEISAALCRVTGVACAATSPSAPAPAQTPPRTGQPPASRPPASQPPAATTPAQATEAELAKTVAGRAALAWLKAHPEVKIAYETSARGSYYAHATKTIHIGAGLSAARRATTLIHEVHHAQNPTTPDVMKLNREDFINAAIDEDVDAQVLAIEANRELQRGRSGVANIPGQAAYEKGGRAALRQAYVEGRVRTSTTRETYRDYYGKAWDKAHTPVQLPDVKPRPPLKVPVP
jgi:hypothetical protein